ncbi:lipocalin family protein [Marinigracilibium pacificum]|uniref:Lipocalin family protein n=1 Tax=Marinigracilibium pacificum TaxID=2729599 RepID=A0A848IX21_9BACT|nr:lipocalin family protein [Marinigracilibium pacificum]NMM49073.1 lipocalin family protein [Marinigracilibium pacificum]
MKNTFGFLIILLSLSCNSNSGSYAPLETVEVDVDKYVGKWYEIASFPNSFQEGCECTYAEYTKEDDHINVYNYCIQKGKVNDINGKAFSAGKGKLKVQFFWPFKGDYYVIDRGDNYEYALVGAPSRNSLWILSRTRQIDDKLYNRLVELAESKGFDTSQLSKTPQSDCD